MLYSAREINTPAWNHNKERIFLEGEITRKNHFLVVIFLFFAGLTLAAEGKELAVAISAAGVIILWILAASIFAASSRLKKIQKELSRLDSVPAYLTGRRFKDKIVSVLYNYLLPSFCAGVVTLLLLLEIVGYADPFMPYGKAIRRIEEEVKPVTKELLKDKPKKEIPSKYFKDIDSISR